MHTQDYMIRLKYRFSLFMKECPAHPLDKMMAISCVR